MYEVINLRNNQSHGEYDSLDQAKGCVIYDGLLHYEIWGPDDSGVVEFRSHDGERPGLCVWIC